MSVVLTFCDFLIIFNYLFNMKYAQIHLHLMYEVQRELFRHYDNRRKDRLQIYGTRESVNFLRSMENYFMNGTSSTVPYNLYIIYIYTLTNIPLRERFKKLS